MKTHRAVPAMIVVTLLAIAPACRATEEGLKEDAGRNAEAARDELKAAREDSQAVAEGVGSEVAQGARDLGHAIEQGAEDVGSDIAAGKQTIDVKAALMLDRSIDSSHIDVETDAATMTVTLTGWVPAASHKVAAEKVARASAEGYEVVNLLTLRAS